MKISLITLLGPAAVMLALGLPFLLLSAQLENPALQVLGSFAGLAVMAPFVGLYAVPLALLIGAWAMRIGLAGRGVALLASVILPLGIGVIYQLLDPTAAAIGAMLILSPVVALHAMALWCATRWIAPDTLIAPAR
ncbi:hypothetical protein [Gymnodinialimonas hymeniacidonis]|uniref:hypothetical protein n=1 Tax=Gymnodinialimonas hymeniacidonis TaxID=3126508 RepID=UPI0034C6B814